jgi:hypothetical protein
LVKNSKFTVQWLESGQLYPIFVFWLKLPLISSQGALSNAYIAVRVWNCFTRYNPRHSRIVCSLVFTGHSVGGSARKYFRGQGFHSCK